MFLPLSQRTTETQFPEILADFTLYHSEASDFEQDVSAAKALARFPRQCREQLPGATQECAAIPQETCVLPKTESRLASRTLFLQVVLPSHPMTSPPQTLP